MQSKFENQNNQGTKHISNAMIAWPWGKISSTGGLRGSIITWNEYNKNDGAAAAPDDDDFGDGDDVPLLLTVLCASGFQQLEVL